MFKPASKLLFGLAGFALVMAVGLAIATGNHEIGMDSILGPLTAGYKGYVGDHIAYSVLFGLLFSGLGLGIIVTSIGEADAEAGAHSMGLETVPEQPVPEASNPWPVVGALSLACIVGGLAVTPALFVVGMVGLVVTAFEWAASNWADRATGDPEVNRAMRNRLFNPIEIPVGAALLIGGAVLLTSRVLLAVPSIVSILIFGLVPAAILALGALIVLRPKISTSTITAVLVAGAALLLIAGIVAAIVGEREHEGGGHEEGAAVVVHQETMR